VKVGVAAGSSGLGRSLWVLLAVLVVAVHAPKLWAQASSSITGTVVAASGAAVSRASVAVKNMETDSIRNAQSDEAGRYFGFKSL
jgi:Carboxypeptidase regulatory-like domain